VKGGELPGSRGLDGIEPEDHEIVILRRMTPAKKLTVLRTLIQQAYELKAAGLRATRPDLSEEEVWKRARALVGGYGT
jgi:hypothetical protein